MAFRVAQGFNLDPEEALDLPFDRLLLYYSYLTDEPSQDQINTALICSTMVNCWSSKKVTVKDFLPRKTTQATDEEILKTFKKIKTVKKK